MTVSGAFHLHGDLVVLFSVGESELLRGDGQN